MPTPDSPTGNRPHAQFRRTQANARDGPHLLDVVTDGEAKQTAVETGRHRKLINSQGAGRPTEQP